MVIISERPPEIEGRVLPGLWGDHHILGKRSGSAVSTLVERHSRYVMPRSPWNDKHGGTCSQETHGADVDAS